MRTKKTILCLMFFGFSGCYYPARTLNPIKTKIIDAKTGEPISGAKVIRVVFDAHDFSYSYGKLYQCISNDGGIVKIKGRRTWG